MRIKQICLRLLSWVSLACPFYKSTKVVPNSDLLEPKNLLDLNLLKILT